MVGHHNARSACCQGFLCRFHSHDSLDDKGLSCRADDLCQFLDGLAACGGLQILQEGKSRCINIHGHCETSGRPDQIEFNLESIDIPGLNGRNTETVFCLDCRTGSLHDCRVGAVTGKCSDSGIRACGNQDIVVGNIIQLISVVQLDGSDRAREEGILHCMSKEVHAGVGHNILTDRIQVDTDLFPGVIVADRSISDTLCSGSGHLRAACFAVALRTCLAIRADTCPRICKNFLIGHDKSSTFTYFVKNFYVSF